jgi:hypothetical protein
VAAFDWESYADVLAAAVLAKIQTTAKDNPNQRFYALAICDEVPPRIALNSEAAWSDRHDESGDRSFASARFNPSEFRFELRLENAKLDELHAVLAKEKKSTAAKRRRALVDAARRLGTELLERIDTTDDFIVYVFDPKQGLALVKKTLPRKLFEKLFPEHDPLYAERQRIERLPPVERAEALMDAFEAEEGIGSEEARKRLAQMGSDAVPTLVTALARREKQRWQIACVLGCIGPTRAASAIPALRRYANDESTGGNWCSMVLGFLGDSAFLIERAKEGSDNCLIGLCAPFRSFADEAQESSGERIAFDYDLLETFLAIASAEQKKAVENELQPGRGYRWHIDPADVEGIVRAFGSRHAVLRWHAASVIGNVKLPRKQGRPVVDALLPLISDRNKLVRRLAILSLQDHRRHLDRAHWQAMADLANDKDPVTKMVADEAREHLANK